ncbi:hypothetical protein [Saccharococcus thermophilus]|uniref:Uncharacterized protein n=1 Tax=Saccharococcus thermophilus TaxID=29396 RepID=A0A846MHW5_9BACL|nr:hypothetical protein [Saccharococcus thermophilus]NIK14614.1 hypothetical protein [Saccharococcus thermophilus]
MKGHKDVFVNLVTFSYEDIPELISLSASVGWDYDVEFARQAEKGTLLLLKWND